MSEGHGLAEIGQKWSGCARILAALIAVLSLLGFGRVVWEEVWQHKELVYTFLPTYDLGTQVFGGLIVENRGRVPLTDVKVILAELDSPIEAFNMPGPLEPTEVVKGGVGEKELSLAMQRLSRGTTLALYMLSGGDMTLDDSNLLVTSAETVGRESTQDEDKSSTLLTGMAMGFLFAGLLGFVFQTVISLFRQFSGDEALKRD